MRSKLCLLQLCNFLLLCEEARMDIKKCIGVLDRDNGDTCVNAYFRKAHIASGVAMSANYC
jgi:hypothetical protein